MPQLDIYIWLINVVLLFFYMGLFYLFIVSVLVVKLVQVFYVRLQYKANMFIQQISIILPNMSLYKSDIVKIFLSKFLSIMFLFFKDYSMNLFFFFINRMYYRIII